MKMVETFVHRLMGVHDVCCSCCCSVPFLCCLCFLWGEIKNVTTVFYGLLFEIWSKG